MYNPSTLPTVEDINFTGTTVTLNTLYAYNPMRPYSPYSPKLFAYTPPASPRVDSKHVPASGDKLLDLILTAPAELIAPSGSTLRIFPAGPSEAYVSVHPRFNRTCIDINFCPPWPDARRVTARVMRDDWERRRLSAEDTRRAALMAYERVKAGLGWQVWEVVLPVDPPVEDDSDPSDDDSGESTASWFSSESDSSI